jgi:hypothetical protein
MTRPTSSGASQAAITADSQSCKSAATPNTSASARKKSPTRTIIPPAASEPIPTSIWPNFSEISARANAISWLIRFESSRVRVVNSEESD